MKRVYSDTYPTVLEKDVNGSYLYRWDIQTETINMSEEPTTLYTYYEVVVWPTLTSNKILETCINEIWGTDVEAKKLNDYNAALLGLLDESYIDTYKEFLQQRKALKEQVESDFNTWKEMQEIETLNEG